MGLQLYFSPKSPPALCCLCNATVWGYIKHTYAHPLTHRISLSSPGCLRPINIHLSGISLPRSLSLSLVPHDRPSKVSVHLPLLIWYCCCQSTGWSLSTFYPRHKKHKKKRETQGPKDHSLWRRERKTVGLHTGMLQEKFGASKQASSWCDRHQIATPRYSKLSMESCDCLFNQLAVNSSMFMHFFGALCGCLRYSELRSVSLLSICVHADGRVYFFSKCLNLSCQQCEAVPLWLQLV